MVSPPNPSQPLGDPGQGAHTLRHSTHSICVPKNPHNVDDDHSLVACICGSQWPALHLVHNKVEDLRCHGPLHSVGARDDVVGQQRVCTHVLETLQYMGYALAATASWGWGRG